MQGFVYNALMDVTLRFSGRQFHFPMGETTVVEDQTFEAPDLYRRNREDDPDPHAILRREITGFDLASKLLDRHRQSRISHGFWLGKRKPTKEEIASTEKAAERYMRDQIAEAKKERHDRYANVPGRSEIDPIVLHWMEKLGVADDIYNPTPPQPIDPALIQAVTAATVAALNEASKASK